MALLAVGFAEDVWHYYKGENLAVCDEPVFDPAIPPDDYRLCLDCRRTGPVEIEAAGGQADGKT